MALAAADAAGHVAMVGSAGKGRKRASEERERRKKWTFRLTRVPVARADHNPRRVTVVDGLGEVLCSRQFPSPVLGLACSLKGHVAVCLGDCIHWFLFTDKDGLTKEVPTGTNLDGLFALSEDGKLLAYPLSATEIGVRHGDDDLARIKTDSPFGKLQFNPKGAGQDLLAASSRDGKTVWVWSLARVPDYDRGNSGPTHELQYCFARSRTHACHVENLSFNAASSLLALSGDTGTVHVFELSDQNKVSSSYVGSIMGSWAPSLTSTGSRFKVRSGGRTASLVALLVGDAFIEGPDAPRSVFVLGADGNLQEFILPDGSDPNNLEVAIPVRKNSVYR